jgi:hypothetical protein
VSATTDGGQAVASDKGHLGAVVGECRNPNRHPPRPRFSSTTRPLGADIRQPPVHSHSRRAGLPALTPPLLRRSPYGYPHAAITDSYAYDPAALSSQRRECASDRLRNPHGPRAERVWGGDQLKDEGDLLKISVIGWLRRPGNGRLPGRQRQRSRLRRCRPSQGGPPIYEPGLAKLIERNQEHGSIDFTTDRRRGIEHGDVIFIAVATPMSDSGEADLTSVYSVSP